MPRSVFCKCRRHLGTALLLYAILATTSLGFAQAKKATPELVFPPMLPGDQKVVTDQSDR